MLLAALVLICATTNVRRGPLGQAGKAVDHLPAIGQRSNGAVILGHGRPRNVAAARLRHLQAPPSSCRL